MGGYKGGEIASKIALDTFQRQFKISDGIAQSLKHSLYKANEAIAQYKEQDPSVGSMGTTLVAVYISSNSFQWVSVGDSLLYLLREGKIKRINANHSVAGMLDLQVKARELTAKEAIENPNRHKLTSALLGKEFSMVEISKKIPFELGDVLILASDGIETLSEEEILNPIKVEKNLSKASENILRLIEQKNKKNQDNATFICIELVVEKKFDFLRKEKNVKVGGKVKTPKWLEKVYTVITAFVFMAMFVMTGFECWGIYQIIKVVGS